MHPVRTVEIRRRLTLSRLAKPLSVMRYCCLRVAFIAFFPTIAPDASRYGWSRFFYILILMTQQIFERLSSTLFFTAWYYCTQLLKADPLDYPTMFLLAILFLLVARTVIASDMALVEHWPPASSDHPTVRDRIAKDMSLEDCKGPADVCNEGASNHNASATVSADMHYVHSGEL